MIGKRQMIYSSTVLITAAAADCDRPGRIECGNAGEEGPHFFRFSRLSEIALVADIPEGIRRRIAGRPEDVIHLLIESFPRQRTLIGKTLSMVGVMREVFALDKNAEFIRQMKLFNSSHRISSGMKVIAAECLRLGNHWPEHCCRVGLAEAEEGELFSIQLEMRTVDGDLAKSEPFPPDVESFSGGTQGDPQLIEDGGFRSPEFRIGPWFFFFQFDQSIRLQYGMSGPEGVDFFPRLENFALNSHIARLSGMIDQFKIEIQALFPADAGFDECKLRPDLRFGKKNRRRFQCGVSSRRKMADCRCQRPQRGVVDPRRWNRSPGQQRCNIIGYSDCQFKRLPRFEKAGKLQLPRCFP